MEAHNDEQIRNWILANLGNDLRLVILPNIIKNADADILTHIVHSIIQNEVEAIEFYNALIDAILDEFEPLPPQPPPLMRQNAGHWIWNDDDEMINIYDFLPCSAPCAGPRPFWEEDDWWEDQHQ
jgi:hypothetical protein